MHKLKPYAHLVSIYLPRRFKSASWLLWERKMMWHCCRAFNADFEWAYGMIRHFESVRENLMQAKACKQGHLPVSRQAQF